MAHPRPCASCGETPTVGDGMYWRFAMTCSNYDGPPDEGTPRTPHNTCFVGRTEHEAIESWNEFNDEYEYARENA